MQITTTHGCTVSAEENFGCVMIHVSNYPAQSFVSLPMKDALLLADMIYTIAGADKYERAFYIEAAERMQG